MKCGKCNEYDFVKPEQCGFCGKSFSEAAPIPASNKVKAKAIVEEIEDESDDEEEIIDVPQDIKLDLEINAPNIKDNGLKVSTVMSASEPIEEVRQVKKITKREFKKVKSSFLKDFAEKNGSKVKGSRTHKIDKG